MYALLFAEEVVDRGALRVHAREEVYGSTLIRACAQGDINSIKALLVGFWPFVKAFETAIDARVGRMPTRPLVQRFGQSRVRAFFNEAREAVREMKDEEGSHALLWRRAADEIGVELEESSVVPGVAALLESANSDDEVEFFCWLAGTEYIAEELAAYLCHSPAFNGKFSSGRWVWGLAHLMDEHEGPSHLEIDEDLARAYHPSTDPAVVGTALFSHIRRCEKLFGEAAADVGHMLAQEIV
ncbi:hypothetical protein AA23498_3549 [Acetobacter nitrogenifigens DSM 23921 = NBRC 105050]|uniref:Thiaminase-2/PQQC domain-containing protein n=1 Tax=Acetobacter nitrogenifigens DSM 23921 = NBRC 105050 TaxID=1120919 RepID=A0A511XE45_9PROT|nr:hypothetical protein [Acetobacter nitrogenifigens]GBQ99775.1 hypothetical protein AA23498_3549 [Acetobacter nitrogenifigens DSM 23921 = NBRC 105050]GEN61222.1 hypothetical protein ANI02nite_31060 [Acetobacter nitrogenifigens DSM 23921 = NBRC 105050]